MHDKFQMQITCSLLVLLSGIPEARAGARARPGAQLSEAPPLCAGSATPGHQTTCDIVLASMTRDESCLSSIVFDIAKNYAQYGNSAIDKMCPLYSHYNEDSTHRALIWTEVVLVALHAKAFADRLSDQSASANGTLICGCSRKSKPNLPCEAETIMAAVQHRLLRQSSEVLPGGLDAAVARYCATLPAADVYVPSEVTADPSSLYSTGQVISYPEPNDTFYRVTPGPWKSGFEYRAGARAAEGQIR